MRMFQSEYKVSSRYRKALNPEEHLILCHFYIVLINTVLSQPQSTWTLDALTEQNRDYFIFLDSAEEEIYLNLRPIMFAFSQSFHSLQFLYFSEFQSLNILICLMGLIAVLDSWCGLEILHVKYLVFDWQKVGAQWVIEVFMAFSPSTVSYKTIPCLQRALGVNSEVLALSNRAVWSCRKSMFLMVFFSL